MTSFYNEIFVRVVLAREIWETIHMLLTNNQNSTMRQYCGELPVSPNLKKPRNSIDCLSHPCSKFLLRNVNRTCQAFDKPASWLSLSLSLSLHLIFSIKIKGGKYKHLPS